MVPVVSAYRDLEIAELPPTGQVITALFPVSYTHLRARETVLDLVCRLLLEKQPSCDIYPWG